jgi:hypothetical protein
MSKPILENNIIPKSAFFSNKEKTCCQHCKKLTFSSITDNCGSCGKKKIIETSPETSTP